MKKAIGLWVLAVALAACGTTQLEAPENQEEVSAQSSIYQMADATSAISYPLSAVPVNAVYRFLDRREQYPNDPRLADIGSYWKVETSPVTTIRCAYNNFLFYATARFIDCSFVGRFSWSFGLRYATTYTISTFRRTTPTSPWVLADTFTFRTLPLVLQ